MADVEVLPGLGGVRKRPGMYIGGTGSSGVAHLAWEVIGNAVDLHLQRTATELEVTLDGRWLTVRDDGPGIPVEPLPGDSISALEAVVTRLHVSATRDGHFPHVHLTPDLRGAGLAVVNALSARVEIETTRDGIRWAQAFERGEVASPLRDLGPTTTRGTTIRLQPDPDIFSIALGPQHLRARLRSLAYLQPLLRITFQGERLPGLGGPTAWVRAIARELGPLAALYTVTDTIDQVGVDLALGWCEATASRFKTFVNLTQTGHHGTHLDGVWQGLATWAASLGASGDLEHVRRSLAPGLVGVIHVRLLDPKYHHPTREHLASPEAAVAVRAILECETRTMYPLAEIRGFLRARLGV